MRTTLPTVDTSSLETVTGGAIRAAGGTDSATLASITQILDTLKSTTNGNGNGCHHDGFGPMGMMMFAMLAMRNNRGPDVVYVGGPQRRWGWGW